MPIEYWYYCDSSDAKRAWKRAVHFKSHRGSTEDLKQEVKQKKIELDMIELMKREKIHWYKECMEELKEKLKERKIN